MNIFKILAANDGKVHEPSVTSLLAYYLDRNQDHGLSDMLLKALVDCFRKKDGSWFGKLPRNDWSEFDIVVSPERHVTTDSGNGRDIDILVEVKREGDAFPIYALCIENKINDAAIQDRDQLEDEINGLQREYVEHGWGAPEFYFCFLTLKESGKSNNEFARFSVNYNKSVHLHWKGGEADNDDSIQKLFESILAKEATGRIDPIPGDSKFLVKSLLAFVQAEFQSELNDENRDRNERQDYGKPLWMHLKEFLDKQFGYSDDLRKDWLGEEFAEYVKKQSGAKIVPITLNCQLTKVIVNDRNRLHYGVTVANHERYDLLFYPDPRDTSIVRRYDSDLVPDSVEVFWKGKNTDTCTE